MEDYMNISAPVFNIQSYSIHDGPGIRSTVFLKGCPLRCFWCQNPESQEAKPQLMTYDSKCTGCGSCIPVCKQKAISLEKFPGEERMYAVTDRTKCINCGDCVPVCYAEAREIVGKLMTVAEALKEVLRDKLFMTNSGGGMTIGGGEPLAHHEFSAGLFRASKEAGIHTAIETCNFASREVVDKVFKYVDLGLCDIKHMESDAHKQYTGVPNEIILDNIQHIYNDLHVPMNIRVPVIPNYNDSRKNIAATAKFVAEKLGKDVPIHLIPYHRMGESKNASLGKYLNMSVALPIDSYMEELKTIVESYGLKAQIGG